jgi:hypothetical protein
MSKKGGKRKKQHQGPPSRTSSRPPRSGKQASAPPPASSVARSARFEDGKTLVGIGPSSKKSSETLRFDAQPLELPRSSERVQAAKKVMETAGPPREEPKTLASAGTIESADAKAVPRSDAQPKAEPKTLVASRSEPSKGETAAPEATRESAPRASPSDVSIPAAVDEEGFFAEGDRNSDRLLRVAQQPDEIEVDPRAARKLAPAVVARRERFARYVKLAVGGAALLCLAAAVRGAVAKMTRDTEPAHVTTVTAAAPIRPEPLKPAAEPPSTVPAAVLYGQDNSNVPVASLAAATGAQAQPAVVAAAPDDKAAAPTAAPASDTPEDKAVAEKPADKPADRAADKPADKPASDTATPAASAGDKTAQQEKKDAQKALDRGKIQDAIDAGERSVALDPTDGEAWLILGAAYQMKAKHADAARCFAACVKQGKRGPIHECRAMLR